jgi:hypothetical protein
MKQILRKATFVISCLFLFFILCIFNLQQAYANPPQNVQVEYDAPSHSLKVTITHNTPMPDFHYIKRVTIKKNGVELSVNEYTSQPTKDTFSYNYDVSAKDGDKLEATAKCSMYGSKTGELTIGK